VYFTPDSDPEGGRLWLDVTPDRVLSAFDVSEFDACFVAGRDWHWLPANGLPPVVNLVQHVKHGDANDPRHEYLQRAATRVCVSTAVKDAIERQANGETFTVRAGIPLSLFRPAPIRRRNSVAVLATKQQSFGKELVEALRQRGAEVTLIDRALPREQFASLLGRSEIFVGLPNEREGLYLPGVEALASGCGLVCADAMGNAEYCRRGQTAMVPSRSDLAGHVQAVTRLLQDSDLLRRLQAEGREVAASFSLEGERESFLRILAAILGPPAARRDATHVA
jgi:hypothetical protein